MGILKIITSGELYKLRKYRIWKGLLKDYKRYPFNPLKVLSIHRKGFLVNDWEILGLTNSNYKGYLSSKQYNSIHPINGYYSKLIDDKITIKYILSGTELSKYMPDYYYIIDENGNLRPMLDAIDECDKLGFQDIVELLKAKKRLAIKLITGSIGKGFYKAEYKDEKIYVNNKELTEGEFKTLLSGLRNYIVSEYLLPHPDIARIWPKTPNTLRYLVGSVNGEWRMIKSFIRFGSNSTGSVENFNAGGVLCYIDENGYYNGGYIIGRKDKHVFSTRITMHPDNAEVLEGRIPCWEDIQACVEGIERLLPQTRYLGFDFVVTDDNIVKILEVNSLTSLDAIQLDKSILATENGKWFFSSFSSIK